MPEPDERKSVVIPIEKGQRVPFVFVCDGQRAAIVGHALTYTGRVGLALYQAGDVPLGELWFQPDPVRAAELKRDERAKCAVYQVLHDKSYAADLINEIYAAIDAPAEPETSEFRSGADAVKTEAMEGIAKLLEAARNDPKPERGEQRVRAYSGAMRLVEDIIVTEPPA